MTLGDIDIPPSAEFASAHALVFEPFLAMRLQELHAEYGRPDCIAMPRQLVDGRLALGADLLLATAPGGWLHAMWQHADMSVLLPNVAIVPWADVELQPEPPPAP